MKEIEPESIPELKIMPYLMIFMMLFGLVAGISGKRTLVYTWILLFFIMASIGMYDFYMWEYDYGHDLNPLAAIKIPGMSYQPPLIGSKMLLNFNAISMPHIATYILAFVVMLAAAALVIDIKVKKKRNESD